MTATSTALLPFGSSLTEIDDKHPIFRYSFILSKQWQIAMQDVVVSPIQDTSQIVLVKTISTPVNAAIATTPFTLGSISAGLYRIDWYTRVTTAAGVSSSLTVTLGWTETAVALTSSGPAMTGNTTATNQSGSVLIRSDASAPITYATTYASNAATAMYYRIDFVVSYVSA